MFKRSRIIWCAAALTLPVLGQEDSANPLRGLTFTVNNEFSYDDNVLRQQDNKTTSRVWTFNPRVAYQIDRAGGTYTLAYDAVHNNYLDSSDDTDTNQTASLRGEQKFNAFNKLGIVGSYNDGFEARGVGFNEGSNASQLGSPTPIIIKELTGNYQLGADRARMRLVGTAGYRATDRDSALIINDSRDYQEELLGASMLYRVGSRTDLVVEYRQREINYSRTPIDNLGREIPLDSQETLYLVGVDLEATAKTTAKVRVGTLERDFKWESAQWEDSAGGATEAPEPAAAAPAQAPRSSGQDPFWELAAVWAPRSYSRFELSSRSSTRESLGIGSYVRSKDYVISWTHNWSTRVGTKLDFSIATDSYRDSGRVDDRKAANVAFTYDFDQRLSTGLGYRYQDVRSTAPGIAYDKSVFYIFANYRNQQTN